jgi:hypothetical protein
MEKKYGDIKMKDFESETKGSALICIKCGNNAYFFPSGEGIDLSIERRCSICDGVVFKIQSQTRWVMTPEQSKRYLKKHNELCKNV